MLNLSQIEKEYRAYSAFNSIGNSKQNATIQYFFRKKFTDLMNTLKPQSIIDPEETMHPKAVEAHNALAKDQQEKINQALK